MKRRWLLLSLLLGILMLFGGCSADDTDVNPVEFDPTLTEEEIEVLSIQFHDLQNYYVKRVKSGEPVQRNLYIGQPIYCYDYVDGEIRERDNAVYPVSLNDEICCLAYKYTGEQGDIRVALTDSLYPELSPYFDDKESIALIYTSNIYALSESGIDFLSEVYGVENEKDEALDPELFQNNELIVLKEFGTIGVEGCVDLGSIQIANEPASAREQIQERFEMFAAHWCEFSGIPVETAKIEMLKEVDRVQREEGEFVFCDMEYSINGVLEPVESIGKIQAVYFERDGLIREIEFISGSIHDYEAYVDVVCRNLKDMEVKEDYTVLIAEQSVGLYQNVMEESLIRELEGEILVAAAHGEGYDSVTSQFCKSYVLSDYTICVLDWLGDEKETVHEITVYGGEAMTARGIHIGDSAEQLMSAYPEELYPLESGHPLGEGYAYLPKDGTSCYIFFQITDGVIEQITLSVGYGGRPLELD